MQEDSHDPFFPKVGDPGVRDVGLVQPVIDALPENEHPEAIALIANLVQLLQYVDEVAACVALLDLVDLKKESLLKERQHITDLQWTKNTSLLRLWSEMAARDAVMSIFHFGNALASIKPISSRLKSLRAERQELRKAMSQFKEKFPDSDMMRHAVGHRGEIRKSVRDLKRHAKNGALLMGRLRGRTYTITFEGEHRSWTVDVQMTRALAEVANWAIIAFPDLSSHLSVPR